MGTIKAKLAVWAEDKALVKLAAGVLALVLALAVALCISICMRSNIHKKYSATINALEVRAYENMTEMTQLFARIDDPSVDVRYKLLPELKGRYTALSAINEALCAGGTKCALLNEDQTTAFAAAFEQYAEAYRQGIATGLAKADLSACMEDVQEMVTLYNTPPEDEADKVLIIDAASGKAVDKK